MRSFALITILALGLAACGGGSGGTSGGGLLKVSITDAPFPGDLVESATIVIREVRARDTDQGGWQVLFEGEREIDLVPLTGGIAQTLVEIEVPPGTYDEVRLIVDAGTVVLKEEAFVVSGLTYPDSHTFSTDNGNLRFPSGSQSGIKVKVENDIVVTTQLSGDLTLDFDLAKNFVFNGTPDHDPGVKRVNFTPVVRAVNSTTAGTVTMRVISDGGTPGDTGDDAPIACPTVFVLQDQVDAGTGDTVEAEISTVVGAADGTVAISLVPGTYRFRVEAMGHVELIVDTDPADGGPIEVVLGNVTALGDVMLLGVATELSGQVLSDMGTDADVMDDMAIEGATVQIFALGANLDADSPLWEATTDGSGAYHLTLILAGDYDVRVSAAGHETADLLGVTFLGDQANYLDVTLVKTP